MTSDLDTFIAGLPKAELHVHHVGSASPRVVAELAARHEGSTPVPADPERLAEFFTFRDFTHFIEVYVAVLNLIRDPEDLWQLIYGVGRDLAAQNARYVELTVTPYTHLINGFAPEQFCEIIEDARASVAKDHGLAFKWIFDIPGELGIPAAESTLRVALDQRPDGLIGFGLGGPEIGVPRRQFAPYFDAARAEGLHSLPHAGETTGPETVWEALRDLSAERIGHGIGSARDVALMEYLAEHRIPLEVCPTSNVCTRAVASLEEHPLPELVKAGVFVTINSDDPPMFGTSLNKEYAVAADLLGLDRSGLADLAGNAVQASFMDEPSKRSLLAEIADCARL
ncbi:adenosine deaminase [Herbidospora mongoliensis]|uniref:adenosine deaminase n=1 Tax=Herbidospora mongoliensis TaxID=688067 RepID=UPI00082F947B|nr:adenosine deaminase [Herbidospora mongoliensis]